jgi:hypothetical protein
MVRCSHTTGARRRARHRALLRSTEDPSTRAWHETALASVAGALVVAHLQQRGGRGRHATAPRERSGQARASVLVLTSTEVDEDCIQEGPEVSSCVCVSDSLSLRAEEGSAGVAWRSRSMVSALAMQSTARWTRSADLLGRRGLGANPTRGRCAGRDLRCTLDPAGATAPPVLPRISALRISWR